MNENDIISKLEDLKSIKQTDINETTKALQTYQAGLKQDLVDTYSQYCPTKKRIRLLKNQNIYQGIMFQEVIVGANDEIIKYGDIFVSGGNATTSGAGRVPITAGFARVAIPQGVEIIDVIGGHANFFAQVKDSADMWVWGNNSEGCLGVGHNNAVPIPTKVTMSAKIKQIRSMSYLSANQFCTILLEDGSVWSCGRNAEGQLGIGNTINSNRFVRVSVLEDIEEIWSGNNFVSGVFAKKGSKTYVWGWNGNGCLGLGKTNTPILAPELHPLANINKVYHYCLDWSGWKGLTYFEAGNAFYHAGFNGGRESGLDGGLGDNLSATEVFSSGIKASDQFVSSGIYGTALLLNSNHNVWSWGYGQFGFGENRTGNSLTQSLYAGVSFKSIHCKPYNQNAFYAQDFNGDLWSFGYNNYALGIGNATDTRVWTKLPTPPNIIDYDVCSYYGTERVFIATDGERLYACGVTLSWNLNYTTNVLQPQILPLGEPK
ncbi:hypothetical protein BKH41_03800 [Helicobacter sp. 12S02232-10]|uniref:RCC1 domain-containing protein n=1 Tax=Helicobacter sp. 12S02232-10 TaxID=1476197 RepID=UPI000BA54A09|nr:hypothetical protein [Helicobacter sp. 12S02232-10]PAF49214.1 hypothetical protein BKH41_03800 [Helicobacter sp. 12S02232-10]